ncbi:MAG TPA: division/cell wall cluster transcriptional repressor MraZ [Acidimicrobiia bacterium]|nr:division/cell wall cluster transcriptional repressor MraZ [Acidimicrobiia bacterium]
MFLGEYEHSLDAKGRVILPAKFRDQLTAGGFVTKGRGGCLSVFTPEEFESVASQVRELSKRGAKDLNAARSFFSGAAEINPDKQGRVALPLNLRNYAGLTREVVVTGVFSRIEVWDRERWLEHDRVGDLALSDSDDLPEFGI